MAKFQPIILDEKLIAAEIEAELARVLLTEERRIKSQSEDAVLKAQQILSTQLERLNDKAQADESGSGCNDSELPEDIQFFSASRLSEKSSGLEIEICFDYELARESQEVRKIIAQTSEPKRKAERRLNTKLPSIARWAGGFGGGFSSAKQDALHIPTICLAAAQWFPKPWLAIPSDERKKLVERFAPVYIGVQPLSISEGYDAPDKSALRCKAITNDNQRGHHFKIYTMSLDWSEPRTRLIQRFGAWLDQHKPPGVKERSHRGHNKPAEWLWALTFYRLARLPPSKRQVLKSKLGIKWSSQLTHGKQRIQKELQRRNYTA